MKKFSEWSKLKLLSAEESARRKIAATVEKRDKACLRPEPGHNQSESLLI